MNGRALCRTFLALLAGAAMAIGTPALAGGRGGGTSATGGVFGGSMQGGGFHGFGHGGLRQGAFPHGGFHRGRGRVVFLAVGGWGYPYDEWPYYADYASYDAPQPRYVEKKSARASSADSTPANAWRYLCDQPSGYYPNVRHCPGGWQMEPARPPSW